MPHLSNEPCTGFSFFRTSCETGLRYVLDDLREYNFKEFDDEICCNLLTDALKNLLKAVENLPEFTKFRDDFIELMDEFLNTYSEWNSPQKNEHKKELRVEHWDRMSRLRKRIRRKAAKVPNYLNNDIKLDLGYFFA